MALYRHAIELRHGRSGFGGTVEFVDTSAGIVTFRGSDGLTCVLNASTAPVALPHGELLIASAAVTAGELPVGAAAWVR